MKKIALLLVIFASFCSSCINRNGASHSTILVKAEDSLTIYLGLPTTMKLYDDKLYIVDMFDGDYMVKIVDPRQSNQVAQIGRKGEGPFEFLNVTDIDFFEDGRGNSYVYIFDPALSKVGIYHIDSLLHLKNDYVPQIRRVRTDGASLTAVMKLERGYIATGLFEKNKYMLLSDSFSITGVAGEYRAKPEASITDIEHAVANNGRTVISLDKKNMLEIVYMASVLSCYDIDGDRIQKSWEYKIKDLDYEIDGRSMINRNVMGYLSGDFGDEYIYALYSGLEEDAEEIATYGKEVHVFDFKGNLVDKIILDRMAFAICVDGRNHKLYAMGHVPESFVTSYDLPF